MGVITGRFALEVPVARPTSTYDLHPSVAYVQTVLANLAAKTGRDLEAWVRLARAEAPAETKARLAWLKAQGLGDGPGQPGCPAPRGQAGPCL